MFLFDALISLLPRRWYGEKAEELQLKNYVYFGMAFSFAVELLNMKMLKSVKPAQLKKANLDDAGLSEILKK